MEIAVPEAADVLVLGDSIAAAWPRTLLETTFPGRRVAKIAVSGERVQQTKWKLETGRFDHLRPRTVILLVGTNNLGRNPACAVSQGILDIVDDVERRWKPEQIVVFGILPRGVAGSFQAGPRSEINATVRNGLAVKRGVRFIELDDQMSCAPCAPYRPDNTHLSTDGYRILNGALR
jgi:lysophospholipase L1-like esterase